jgi:cold-inducible RNA-binding protein
MKNKLYVGNISFQLDEDGLSNAFSEFGTVKSSKIIMDRDTGRSKGFGFIEMENEEQAESAISNLDGKEVSGRPLRVSLAREKTDRPRGGGGGGRRF